MLLDRPALLGALGDHVEAADLALALHARRMVWGQALDQGLNAVSKLKGEVRRRGAGELAHVLDAGLALKPVRLLELTHTARLPPAGVPPAGLMTALAVRARVTGPLRGPYGALIWTGTSSVIWSMRDCWGTETVLSSPSNQTRL